MFTAFYIVLKMNRALNAMGSLGISSGSRSPILAEAPLLRASEDALNSLHLVSPTVATRNHANNQHSSPQSVTTSILPTPVGCSPGSATRTVVTMGNFEGDATRMQVVLDQSLDVTDAAAKRGNIVHFAIMGNVVPDVHQPTSGENGSGDSMSRALKMSNSGHPLRGTELVSKENVVLMIGARELGWLRLANTNPHMREIAPFDDPDSREVLKRKTPLHSYGLKTGLPSWHAHNQSLQLFDFEMTTDVAAVCMFIKLVSIAQLTMNAPGLVMCIAKRMQEFGDAVAYMSLFKFLETYDGTIQCGTERLLTGRELTMEGLGLLPAAREVITATLLFACTELTEYLDKGKLAHCITNGHAGSAHGGLWLCALGDDVIGKIPKGVQQSGMGEIAILYDDVHGEKSKWKDELNRVFKTFYSSFKSGEVNAPLYESFIAMSIATRGSPLPLKKLANDHCVCSGVCIHESTPFGTIQRRCIVNAANGEGDVIERISECWTGINTDAFTPSTYWGVATWCGGTVKDLCKHQKPVLNKLEKMSTHLYNVSVTLATLLSASVGGRRVVDHDDWKLLNGLLGPVVKTTKSGNQDMRVISFTHKSMDTAFIVLVHEAFIQESFDYKNCNMEQYMDNSAPFLAVEGFLALPDDFIIPLNLPGVSVAEVESIRNELGTRLWAIPKKRSTKEIASFTRSDYAAIAAMQASNEREIAIPGYHIFHTRQDCYDAFSGLNVSLVQCNVPGKARMTLDTDTSAHHALYYHLRQ